MSIALLILISVLAASVSNTGGDLRQSWKFHESDCASGKAKAINIFTHLLINLLSTIVLASSNFFMQVLNAPSTYEIDAAHADRTWLDIGIPSWRNAFHLSRFKLAMWLSLLLTSVSLHVLFNSSVFLMDSLMGDFHLTIATQSFLEGGNHLFPGASLYTNGIHPYSNGTGDDALLPTFEDLATKSYEDSAYTTNTSDTAARASTWKRLKAKQCRNMYGNSCAGLKIYRNVVAIADGPGWRRSDLWNLTASTDKLWEPIVPRGELNTLWSSVQCEMSGTMSGTTPKCNNNCNLVLSNNSDHDPSSLDGPAIEDLWLIPLHFWEGTNDSTASNKSGTRPRSGNITQSVIKITHCQAELRYRICAVALSKPVLLAVVVSVFVKVVTCVIVIRGLRWQEPLITPGDAISYFISAPSNQALVSGLLTQKHLRRRELCRKPEDIRMHRNVGEPLGPQQWITKAHGKSGEHHRRACAVPRRFWVMTTIIYFLGLFAATICLAGQIASGISLKWIDQDSLEPQNVFPAIGSGIVFIYSILAVNVPQLYLSFWYLAYNSLITRLEMGREWALFSVRYCSLRVTHPKGQQVATYRLQLRYKYSISLIAGSALSHWLLSNALFIIVSEGSYNQLDNGYHSDAISLPRGATVSIGTASWPVLALAMLCSIMMILLWAISQKTLPGYMPVVGSNSLAMAAACRVSPLAKFLTSLHTRSDGQNTEIGGPVPLSDAGPEAEKGLESGSWRNMAHYRLRWGEVEMPEDWYGMPEHGRVPERVEHLGFGTVFDDPKPPVEGRWYN